METIFAFNVSICIATITFVSNPSISEKLKENKRKFSSIQRKITKHLAHLAFFWTNYNSGLYLAQVCSNMVLAML